MQLVFQIVFSVPVISQIKSIGGGQEGEVREKRRQVGSQRQVKKTHSGSKSSAVPSVCDTN